MLSGYTINRLRETHHYTVFVNKINITTQMKALLLCLIPLLVHGLVHNKNNSKYACLWCTDISN